jgi:hypothetical protein
VQAGHAGKGEVDPEHCKNYIRGKVFRTAYTGGQGDKKQISEHEGKTSKEIQ